MIDFNNKTYADILARQMKRVPDTLDSDCAWTGKLVSGRNLSGYGEDAEKCVCGNCRRRKP